MEHMQLVMMGIMGLAAGWIASQIVGANNNLVSNLASGVAGAYVGGYLQRYLKLDLTQIGNPLAEQIAIATFGAVVVIVAARAIAQPGGR